MAMREHRDYGVQLWMKSTSSLRFKITYAGNEGLLSVYVGSRFCHHQSHSYFEASIRVLHKMQGIVDDMGDLGDGHILCACDFSDILCTSTSQLFEM